MLLKCEACDNGDKSAFIPNELIILQLLGPSIKYYVFNYRLPFLGSLEECAVDISPSATSWHRRSFAARSNSSRRAVVEPLDLCPRTRLPPPLLAPWERDVNFSFRDPLHLLVVDFVDRRGAKVAFPLATPLVHQTPLGISTASEPERDPGAGSDLLIWRDPSPEKRIKLCTRAETLLSNSDNPFLAPYDILEPFHLPCYLVDYL
ncbi:hypothetical protein P175DRAFT_0527377 [Aspergillus ochraceoroseus IBT 24754]|uniref:Uncharacterized protein n=1 Tax=Aspergillus ochraceoroseus IBT 24754 TaxID=1392256 RepID=A0A2T5M5W0_9EURO|nr:uncharacterized protein P175DRAFT_0527377 [Aspergillus ochraceoroseus IBT 24754]PTU23923.1 hypothetical protein P175DRAFT_0527377 [Aspergillus ochraceoroseus IBT 24754]